MQRKRLSLWLTLMLVAVTVLAGCAPRAGGVGTAEMARDADILVDLPAIVIDFDSAGQPSIGNVPLAQLGNTIMPGVLDSLVLGASEIAFLTESNIQHIQVSNAPNGLLLLVNGQSIPSLRWDGEILSATADVLELLGVGVPVLEKLLPMITQIGIGAIVRFPVAADVAAIPTHVESSPAAVAARQAQSDFLATVGTPPRVVLPVAYSADGSWRVGDLSGNEWSNLTGIYWGLNMRPDAINALIARGITEISIHTDVNGIHVAINGHALPYIGWADGEINHVLDIAEQMNLWTTLADVGINPGEIVAVVESLLPIVQTAETSINVTFPRT
jgi:sulfur carrier protein ThiS